MKRHIVFDVDRTLVDSYEPELTSLQEAIKNVTSRDITREEMSRLTTLPTTDFFKSINLSDEEITLVNAEWEKTFAKTQTLCFPGIKEVIRELSNKGFTINVITSRTLSEFHELDKELEDILPLFNVIVTSDIVDLPKPNPASMNYLCEKLNCSSNDVIYIGDSVVDKLLAINSHSSFIPACWESQELTGEENACYNPLDVLKTIELLNDNKEETRITF